MRLRQRGSVTAEFAMAVPAALLVLAACMAGLQVAGLQVRLQDAAADAARGLGRGDSASIVAGRLGHQVPGAGLGQSRRADLMCARVSVTAPFFFGVALAATSCALDGGR